MNPLGTWNGVGTSAAAGDSCAPFKMLALVNLGDSVVESIWIDLAVHITWTNELDKKSSFQISDIKVKLTLVLKYKKEAKFENIVIHIVLQLL